MSNNNDNTSVASATSRKPLGSREDWWGEDPNAPTTSPSRRSRSGPIDQLAHQDRPTYELLKLVERWVRTNHPDLRESEVEQVVEFAKMLKKNSHQNGLRDVDIVAKVTEKVRG